MAISRADLLKELLPGLNQLFGVEYAKTHTRYSMKFRYGKYSIYRNEYSIELQRWHSTTLAKGLDKHTAIGMMKLLEDPK
jgi:hypothetical protein